MTDELCTWLAPLGVGFRVQWPALHLNSGLLCLAHNCSSFSTVSAGTATYSIHKAHDHVAAAILAFGQATMSASLLWRVCSMPCWLVQRHWSAAGVRLLLAALKHPQALPGGHVALHHQTVSRTQTCCTDVVLFGKINSNMSLKQFEKHGTLLIFFFTSESKNIPEVAFQSESFHAVSYQAGRSGSYQSQM